jgi:hypothetical protein
MPTSYTDIFGGGTVQPSQVSYQAYTLTEDITLVWPTSFVDSPNVTARYMELTAIQDGLAVTFPSAEIVSVGYDLIINNIGTHDITLNNNQGALIVNLAAGSLIYLVLVDNTTAAGVWRVAPFAGGAAAVTQVAAVSDTAALTITGSPIIASGTLRFALSLLNLWNAQGDNTLSGSKILQNSLAGSKLVDNSTLLVKMRSTGHSGFVVGNDADYKYSELLYSGNASQLWYLPTQAAQGAIPSLQPLLAIWNAQTANTLTGVQLLANSTPATKIKASEEFVPFCMGYAAAGGNLLKSRRVGAFARTAPGEYQITFLAPTATNGYIVLAQPDSSATSLALVVNGRQQSGFQINVRRTIDGVLVDANFSFIVLDIS